MATLPNPAPESSGTPRKPEPENTALGRFASRYDANARLIRRRLADEQRMVTKSRPWWKKI